MTHFVTKICGPKFEFLDTGCKMIVNEVLTSLCKPQMICWAKLQFE